MQTYSLEPRNQMKHALWLCTFSSAPALLSHFVMSVLELIAFFPMTYGFFHSFSRTRTKSNLFYRSIKFKENIYDLMECKNNFSFSRIVTTFNKSCEIFHFLFFQRDKKKHQQQQRLTIYGRTIGCI